MRRAILPRDSDRTGFTATLEALLDLLPDALCATFLDSEGETIDLATRVDPFDARIYSAEFALPLASMRAASRELGVGTTRELRLVGAGPASRSAAPAHRHPCRPRPPRPRRYRS